MGQEGGDDEKKQLSKSYFDVLGLCCSSEVPLIEKILTQIDGVKDVSVIVPSRTVIVVHDTLLVSTSDIVNALNQARLEANVKVHGEINHHKKWPSPYAVASGILFLLSFLKYAYHPFQWLALGAVAAGIFPVILKGFGALRNFRIDINILVLVAVIGTIAMQDYLEAGTIVFLFTSAEWLESRASHKASAEMSALMSIAPQTAVMAETGEVVDVSEIKLNTILAVKAGEVIPIDGIVVDGKCEVDEKTLTGESFPITKQKDSNVWAGTINLNGYVSIKTTVIAEDCVVAKMAKLVEEAQNKKSRTQRFVDECAKYYTPAILVISICFAIVPVALRVHNRNHWFHLALVVLVSACPCALVLSTPVATFCALTKAAKSGLLIKGGDYLETLAKIRNIALDKTGTITRGEFVVEDFRSLDDDISSETLLYWVSSIESKSSHPMAAALVGYARSFSVEPKPELVQEFQNFPGEGIYGKIDGKDVYIGNKKIAVRAGCETVSSIDVIGEGKTVGLVFSGTNPVGVFSLSDACRSGAVEAIKELKSLKIKTAMLTGDSKAAAMHSQNQLGHALDVVHSELLPEDKAKIIQRLKEDGPTAMVGDGINDAPALATADIGISMGISGSALATETGHVILMSNDIRKIPKAITLARKAHRKVVENVILSIGTKGAILALAFAGHPLVWAAVLADAGTCIVVILNSMLLLREHNERKKTCCRSSAGQQKDRCRIRKMNSANNHPNCCSSDVGSKVSETEQCSTKICALKCQTSSPVSGVAKNCCSTENSCRTSAPTHDHSHSHGHDTSNNNSSHVHHCCSSQSKLRNGRANSQQSCRSTNCHSNDPEASICRKSKLLGLTTSQEDLGKANCVKHRVKACDGHKPCCSKPNQSSCCSEEKNCNRGKCATSTRSGEQGITEDPCHKMHCDEKHCSKEGLGQTNKCRPAHNDQLTLDIDHCWKSGSDCCPPAHHTVIDVETSSDCTESASIHICNNLVKREVGGCCKSYMKECCGKQGHLASGLGGCLAEIISE